MVTARLKSGESGRPELLVAGAHRALASFDLVLAERLARAAADAGGGVPAAHVLAQSLLVQGKDGGEVLARIGQLDTGAPERAITAQLRALGLCWSARAVPQKPRPCSCEPKGRSRMQRCEMS